MPIMRWRIPTNWKFPAFSFADDGTHGAMTHLSVNAAAIGPQGAREGGGRHGLRAAFPSGVITRNSARLPAALRSTKHLIPRSSGRCHRTAAATRWVPISCAAATAT